MEQQKKIAAINDMSGYGRCSLTVSLPIISHLGVQCCPVPTAIFSNHTGYPEYYFDDYTKHLPEYLKQWKKLNLNFSGITSGYLGSLEQIGIVSKFIDDFADEDTVILVDPVMGDNGKLYSIFNNEMVEAMKCLVKKADILTPNLTECCMLTGNPYVEKNMKLSELNRMAKQLSDMGPEKVVITGIPQGSYIANFVYVKGKTGNILRTHKVDSVRCGTGDVFASIIAADAVNGVPFAKSVKRASDFVKQCILASVKYQTPKADGVCFEEVLYKLKKK